MLLLFEVCRNAGFISAGSSDRRQGCRAEE
jgi:hypothetical protein